MERLEEEKRIAEMDDKTVSFASNLRDESDS